MVLLITNRYWHLYEMHLLIGLVVPFVEFISMGKIHHVLCLFLLEVGFPKQLSFPAKFFKPETIFKSFEGIGEYNINIQIAFSKLKLQKFSSSEKICLNVWFFYIVQQSSILLVSCNYLQSKFLNE